ncbi:MAG: MOSC domain-containing protein, partial [Myxococcota bacterium]
MLERQSFFALAARDERSRPWATLLSGPLGFARWLDPKLLSVLARPQTGDALESVVTPGAAVAALGLDFESRARIHIQGHIQGSSPRGLEIASSRELSETRTEVHLRRRREGEASSRAVPALLMPRLDRECAALVAEADTVVLAHGGAGEGLCLSHRIGRPGFVLVVHETELLLGDVPGASELPDGESQAGLLFTDFERGALLQLTGTLEVLLDPTWSRRFPGADRALRFRIEDGRYLPRVLQDRWTLAALSPSVEGPPGPAREPSSEGPSGRILSVNLSMPETVRSGGRDVSTGIFKRPMASRRQLRRLNLDGDGQADLWGHGGAFRAVYLYPHEHYAYWAQELGRHDLQPGQFGENFTVEGLLEDEVHIGDVFRVGSALVEVTQPRVPCYKLAMKIGVEGFERAFQRTGRVGFYVRVLEMGEVGPGDALQLVGRDPHGMSVREVNDLLYHRPDDVEGARRALRMAALSPGWQGSFVERVQKAEDAGFRDFIVRQRVPESEGITSFYLEPLGGGELPDYPAGQFLTFELDVPGHDEKVYRTYSLSDAPRPDHYRVSIKRERPPGVPPGLASNYFHDHVQVGSVLRVAPPRGKFVLDLSQARNLVLLSAGVGITPLLSMLEAAMKAEYPQRVWFFHGARNGREHAFGARVRALEAEHPQLSVHVAYSAPREGEDLL